jgi:hypothetical protein
MVLPVFMIFVAIFYMNFLESMWTTCLSIMWCCHGQHRNTAVADVHAPIVAGLSAIAGNPVAVWVPDVPVFSAVDLLLSTLILLIFFHLEVNALSSTALYFA